MVKPRRDSRLTFGLLMVFSCFFILYGCDGGSGGSGAGEINDEAIDTELRILAFSLGLTGDPSTGRELPDINEELPNLGMKLFFTKALGGDMDSACVSCHHPVLGGADRLSTSVGVGSLNPDLLGPGRSHPSGPNVPRNAPTTFNVGMWDQVLFFDGRIESLGKTPGKNGGDGYGIRTPETVVGVADPDAGANLPIAQTRFPVTSIDEMRGFVFETGNGNETVRLHLAGRIGDYGLGKGELTTNTWLEEFKIAAEELGLDENSPSEELITYPNISKAIAAYQRSQVFVDNPWKVFLEGDDSAISESAKRGALLFFKSYDQGGANCAACHSGDFFSSEQYFVLATPQVGEGKEDDGSGDDFGRFRETGDENDLYAFRTPSLLNVEVTAPYGHAGAYTGLRGIVEHHLDPATAVENYDYSQLAPDVETSNTEINTRKALAKLEEDRQAGFTPLRDLEPADTEIDDIVNFLLALTDPCVKDRQCLSPWIPDAAIPNPDGLRVNAIDENGDPL